MLIVAGLGLAAAACQDPNMAQPAPGYYQPAPPRYASPYYAPAPVYARPAPAYYYGNQPAYYGNPYGNPYVNQPGSHGYYNQADGRRYTTVTVTNRGQNGNRDDIVRQQVVCGSQYYDGYQTRTAPTC
jgi:hypothetical protein